MRTSSKNRLIDTSIKILRLLYANELGTNEIIKQTSSDRSYVIKIRDTLIAVGLIDSKKPKWRLKRNNKLSKFGKDLVELIIKIEEYYNTYDSMLKNLAELLIPANENRISKLKEKGWDEEDIKKVYSSFLGKSREYVTLYSNSLDKVFNSIFIILNENNYVSSKKNQIIKDILDEIILKALSKNYDYFEYIISGKYDLKEYKSLIELKKNGQIDDLFNIGVRSFYKIPKNKFELVKKMFYSQIAMIKPDINRVKTEIEMLEKDVEKMHLENTGFNCLLSSYKEYHEKYNAST